MQGGYQGVAPFLNSPLSAFSSELKTVNFTLGTNISDSYATGFADAIAVAKASEFIISLGGIDKIIAGVGWDRSSIVWPGNQLDLVAALAKLGKPILVNHLDY